MRSKEDMPGNGWNKPGNLGKISKLFEAGIVVCFTCKHYIDLHGIWTLSFHVCDEVRAASNPVIC